MESKLKPLAASNRTIPKLGLSKLPKPSGIPAAATKRKPVENNEAQPAKKPKAGPPVTGRTMGKPPATNRSGMGTMSQRPGTKPAVTSKGFGGKTNMTGANRLGRPGLRRASSTGSLATRVTQPSMQARTTGIRSKIGSMPSRPMTTADKLKDLQQRLNVKDGDLAFKDDEVNRLTEELNEIQELLADKQNIVLQNESTIDTLSTTVATHSATIATLQSTLTQVNSVKVQLEVQVQSLQTTLEGKETEILHKNAEITNLQKSNETHQTTITMLNERISQNEQLQAGLQLNIDSLTNCLKDKERELAERRGEIAELKASIENHLSTIKGLNYKIIEHEQSEMQMQFRIDSLTESLKSSQSESQQRAEKITSLEDDVTELEAKARAHETERRRLHNTIQELKGNIRVFCRVRPLLGDETLGHSSDEPEHMNFLEEDPKVLQLEKVSETNTNDTLAGHKKGQKYEFKFDRVFSPGTSQMQVFEEISQLVQSALDGYNVCIFAYGQTGSGKTYTMEGGNGEENRGMIPRAVEQVFETASELKDHGWEYEFHGQFMEIYNETIRDLLGEKDSNQKHEVKLAGPNTTEVTVTNLKTMPVEQENQVHTLLHKAAENRAVAATKCNERSSRSHSVFRLHIKGNNKHTQESCTSTLNLVDLAGSERLKDSGSEGQRLKETQAINKSLANLGNCIMALANKDHHVPFRNSKLTHLLQNSLGGNSKVLMFVNISPKEECTQESLCSLRFATKVNNCNIGTASVVTKK